MMMMKTAIVGTGDLAYALCHLHSLSGKDVYHTGDPKSIISSGGSSSSSTSTPALAVTKPCITEDHEHAYESFHETRVPVLPFQKAISGADVVILAIPASALGTFVSDHINILKEKILVDPTNSTFVGEDLATLLKGTNIRWIKAFNDIGAADILANTPDLKKKVLTKICSPYKQCIVAVLRLVWHSFGLDAKVVPFSQYEAIAHSQYTIGKEWIHATIIMLCIHAFTQTYAIVKANYLKGTPNMHIPLYITNKAASWTTLWGFALTQLPGVIARLINHCRRDNLRSYHPVLKWSLGIRKQLGVVCTFFLGIHVLMSLLIMNPAYLKKWYLNPNAPNSKMNVLGETSFMFATIATLLYIVMGIASLPSVGANMNCSQWQLVYGPLAWIALALATAHPIVLGYKNYSEYDSWPGGLPPMKMTSILIPLPIMALKLLVCLIAFTKYCLRSINCGFVRPKLSQEEVDRIRRVIHDATTSASDGGANGKQLQEQHYGSSRITSPLDITENMEDTGALSSSSGSGPSPQNGGCVFSLPNEEWSEEDCKGVDLEKNNKDEQKKQTTTANSTSHSCSSSLDTDYYESIDPEEWGITSEDHDVECQMHMVGDKIYASLSCSNDSSKKKKNKGLYTGVTGTHHFDLGHA